MSCIQYTQRDKSPAIVMLAVAVTFSSWVWAEASQRDEALLESDEYRGELEEVVVKGSQPEWRTQQQPEWRPERFKLPEQTSSSRMEWMPEYTRDERDQYDGVRDRKNEKAEIKLFQWKF